MIGVLLVAVAAACGVVAIFALLRRSSLPPPDLGPPPTLLSLFLADHATTLKRTRTVTVSTSVYGGKKIDTEFRIYYDVAENTKFVAFYVPPFESSYFIYQSLIWQVPKLIREMERGELEQDVSSGTLDVNRLPFSGRVLLYHEEEMTYRQKLDLIEHYKMLALALELRGNEYLAAQTANWKGRRGGGG